MKRKKIIQFSLLLAFLFAWSFIILFLGTEKIVQLIGITNSNIIIFIVGSIGGVSTLTSTSFYTTLLTFANGGVNPFYLGIFGGLGITIGDSLFYYLGKKGRESLSHKAEKITKKFSNWMNKRSIWTIPLVTFVYSGLTPFPNDILMIALGISKYKYRRILLPLIIGNILLTTIVALTASKI